MYRLLALVAAALLTAVACGDSSSAGSDPRTNASPPPGDSRSETITWAREVDPCALLDPAELREFGDKVLVGTSAMTSSCEAVIDGGPAKQIGLEVRIGFAPQIDSVAQGSTLQIDGHSVHRIDVRDTVPQAQRGQLTQSECDYRIPVENGLGVSVSIKMERDGDPCGAGDKLMPSVLRQWFEHPEQGSSPATAVTALTALPTPCVGLVELQATHKVEFNWQEQTLDTCYLTVDGSSTLISLEYRERELITSGAQEIRIGERLAYQSENQGDTFIDAIVGDEFAGVWANRAVRELPFIGVMSHDPAVARAVAEVALSKLPK